ncbi:MAG: 30S ribosomal protein S8 [Candidatus Aenigmarchaeota archaeon]|nr:30S ribosomal protein S8 [Candidatus Aenigmarchaeota archaeon]
MRHDILSDVLYVMNNAEKIGRATCTIPASNLVKNVLKVLQKENYIGSFEFADDGKSGHFAVELIGKINFSRSIKPRFFVKKDDYEKWEKRYLPAKGYGVMIVSTSKGVMSQKEAEKLGIGGRLLGCVY